MPLVVAGAGGDSGKTLVSLGLAAAWHQDGVEVQPFKKGPDYIDAAWLTRAAGRPARNLDEWIMGAEAVRQSFARHAATADVSLIEGNRGLFDGLDGTSTAALAKLLGAPVLLVVDVTKTTRTAAAFVVGCQALDPTVQIAGVVLNRVGGPRHLFEARSAIEAATGVPVLGAIPKLAGENLLPNRHLGLVPPEEHDRMGEVAQRLGAVLREHADLDAILEIARLPGTSGPPESGASVEETSIGTAAGRRVKVGLFSDSAFTFYYPENLEALREAGADLVPVSALEDERLPDVDLLYIGGGFPETHAPALSKNRSMLRSVRVAARDGLPIYAECGGLIYLSRSVLHEGRRFDLSGVLDVDVEVSRRPQGHGYVEAVADRDNPFFPRGTVLRGHEFHYSRIAPADPDGAGSGVDSSEWDLALDVRRGTGSRFGRDGLVAGNVYASWIHLHALGTPSWAPALVERARIGASGQTPCGSPTA